MSGHQVTVVPVLDSEWAGRCSCQQVGPVTKTHWEAVKWTLRHTADVERIKTHLSGRAPTLKDQRDYFRSKAADDGIPFDQRTLWDQLADELDRRLGDDPAEATNQPQLF